MSSSVKEKYQAYREKLLKIADLEAVQAILNWDKEVHMPPAGNTVRARQLASLAGMSHEIASSNELGDILSELEAQADQLTAIEAQNVAISLKDYRRQKKYSKDFVQRRSLISSSTYDAWVKAREANNAKEYLPALDQMIQLKREETEILGYEDHPYDALIDLFEPEMRVAELDVLFRDVKDQLVEFVAELRSRPQVDNTFLQQHYPKDQQWELGIELLKGIGYDFNAGRQDISRHPFTTTFGPGDIRVTTRIDEHNLDNMTWSSIHEGGHALYEQGLPAEEFGLPSGRYTSLGIHESQSRLWENNVGRGMDFWQHWYPALKQRFKQQLAKVSLSDFYKGINKIHPGLVRTESDELHYHFHVLIRYEVEKQLIEGKLKTADLPDYWASKYQEYLALEIPDDRQGILQDIHWSLGSIGYFPTYSLGSFYAAQFYQQAAKDIENLDQQLQVGNTQPLLDWLKNHIHRHGQIYSAGKLCLEITGEKLNFQYFMQYAKKKYGKIYS